MIVAALRFFQAAAPVPAWLALLTVGIGLYAAAVTAINPSGGDEALATLLLWQMFCASTGFSKYAAAGHFDVVLVRWPRGRVAAVHAWHSVWPVMTLWAVIAIVEAASARRMPLALEPGRLAALAFVSFATWSLSLPGSRLVAGAVWLLLIMVAATTRLGAEQYAAMLARADGGFTELLHAAALTIVCPFLLIGDHLPARAAVTSIVALLAAGALGAGMAYVRRRDFPLEAFI